MLQSTIYDYSNAVIDCTYYELAIDKTTGTAYINDVEIPLNEFNLAYLDTILKVPTTDTKDMYKFTANQHALGYLLRINKKD